MTKKRRRGRPPRSKHERASKRLDLRLTATEFSAIKEMAQFQGRPLAAAVRAILMAHYCCYAERPHDLDDDDDAA